MNTIVTWIWNGVHLGGRPYMPAHVNTLRRAIARKTKMPHRFVCVADSSQGFDKEVEVVITPPEAAKVGQHRSPEGHRFPSCYRRLYNFSEKAKAWGDLILCIDADIVPTNDWEPLFDYDVDFVGWRPYRDWGAKLRFGGGIYLLKPGTRTRVWTDFKGAQSIQRARACGYRGSDQAWISFCLATKEPYYGKDAGIYSIRDLSSDRLQSNGATPLPGDARLVQFNGPVKPWQSPLPWVKQHWT